MHTIPTRTRGIIAVALAVALGPGAAAPLLAAEAATIDGQVLRAGTDRPVAGATVHAVDRRTGAVRSAAPTGADGRFRFSDLAPGVYEIGIEADGGLYVDGAPVALAPGASRFLDLEIARTEGPRPEPNPPPDPMGRFGRKMSLFDNPLTAALIVIGSAVAVGSVYEAAFNENDSGSTASPSTAN